MLAILSPAKDMKVVPQEIKATEHFTIPEFLDQSAAIMIDLKKLKPADLSRMMKISDKLAILNYDRYHNWNKEHNLENSSQAVLSFNGEAYRGLDASSLSADQLDYLQSSLRILSGLYGVLKPLDLIQAYRLEMVTKSEFRKKKNLYEFWRTINTKAIKTAIDKSPGDKVLVHVASAEYASSIDFKKLNRRVVVPAFYNEVNGNYKMVSVYAKKARGMMARFICENKIENVDDLKTFEADGYFYDASKSTDEKFVFLR